MGNDQSLNAGIEIHQKAVEVTDFYSHHTATINFGNVNNLSVFVGEPLMDGSIWNKQTPLERSAKNLMIYRHPCILKYVSSWEKGSKFHLAIEDVKPLSQVISSLTNLQVCIGLHSLLKALSFLHEKALASHNNVCLAAIYITKDGIWKLGGMEYLCKFKDITIDYMNKTRSYRYSKATDPNEQKYLNEKCNRLDFIDVYGFGVLVNEVLKKKNDDIPHLSEFLELCQKNLQNIDIKERPKISNLLNHDFFNHDFIQIQCFLMELPLKSEEEKNDFFCNLVDNLKKYDELVVASQLANLLLSRMVLLNKVAQEKLIPFLLCPREDSLNNSTGLFSVNTFKKYLVPKLLEIYCVRDAQIRLLLLDHLVHYLNCFEVHELQSHILPELLVGIKDTNDHLVAVTLRALSDLVPILGSASVIGGKRAKLFNDGRPITHYTKRIKKTSRTENNASPMKSIILVDSETSILETMVSDLPERPSPDGEEGETSTEDLEQEAVDDGDNWEDWDVNDHPPTENMESIRSDEAPSSISLQLSNQSAPKKNLPDILELDIKNQKDRSDLNDIDFFQDMEPEIQPAKIVVGLEAKDVKGTVDVNKKFGVLSVENQEEGWGEEDW